MDHFNFDGVVGGGGFWEKMCTVAQNKEIYCKIMKKQIRTKLLVTLKKTCIKEIVQCLPPKKKCIGPSLNNHSKKKIVALQINFFKVMFTCLFVIYVYVLFV